MEVPSTMRAGQWDPKQQKAVINEIPTPQPAQNQILVRITSASLCLSDIRAISKPSLKEPFTVGHEGSGVVVGLHSSSKGHGFDVGDAIGFLYVIGSCFACEGCAVHKKLCLSGQAEFQGFAKPGYMAEYAVVDWRNAIHLPQSWDLKSSSIFFCAGITAYLSVDSCQLSPGQWFGVVGAGGVGQLATQYAKAMDLNVVAADINDNALQSCAAKGVSNVFNCAEDDGIADILALTSGGVHAVAVYSSAKAAYDYALKILRLGGSLMVIGLMEQPLEINTLDLTVGKFRIMAESVGNPEKMQKALDFTNKYNIKSDYSVRRLEDLNDMLGEMRAGLTFKRMVVNP